MIHEVKHTRAGNKLRLPLFFCTSCREMFAGDSEPREYLAQLHGWPDDEECPQCGYLEEDEEAADRLLPRGVNDYQS